MKSSRPQPPEGWHSVTLDVDSAGFDAAKACEVAVLTHLWCGCHCRGEFRVDQDHRSLTVSFSDPQDCALFHISREHLFFEG